MSIYAIGDIHGCFDALQTIFKEIPRSKEDVYVFLGDYIDRGPHSKQSLDWLIEFSKNHHAVFLRGNHEIFMLTACSSNENLYSWLFFGGEQTLDSYKIDSYDKNWQEKVPQAHWNFLKNTIPYHQIEQYLFVHAGLTPGKALEEQNANSLYWEKYEIPEPYSDSNIVICGHTSRKNGIIADFGHTICIDTCAYCGQWLCCLNVETKEYYQANLKKEFRTGWL